MNFDVNRIPTRTVSADGADVHVVDRENLDAVLQQSPTSTKRWFEDNVDLVRRYPELLLGYYVISPRRPAVWLVLLSTEDGFRRMGIEYVTCATCGWYGAIGNPTIPDLYWGTPDSLAALRQAAALSKVGCPRCGSALPRDAVWVATNS